MVGRVACHFGAARVNDDGRFAFHGELFHLRAGDGVRIGRIGADDHDAIRVLQVNDRIGGRSGAERALHPQGGGRVAYPCAGVNVVGADDRADEFLHQVVLFVGATRGRDARDGVGAVLRADNSQFVGDKIVGLLPGGGLERPVAANERGTDPVRMFVERESEAALQTRMPLVDFRTVRRLYGFDLSAGNRDLQVAADTAVGANGLYLFIECDGFRLEHIRNGRGGASLRAGAATDAIGVEERIVETLDDLAIEAPARHTQHQFSLHLVASAHATETIDALGEIGSHIRVAQVFFPVQMVFAFRVTYVADAHARRDGLQFTVVVDFAGETVQRVVGQHQFDDVAAQFPDARTIGVNIRALHDGRVAGCLGFGGTARCERHIHAAHPAGAEGFEVGRVAQGGDHLATQMPSDKFQDGFARLDGIWPVIDPGDFAR